MIDAQTETLVSLADAAKLLPARRAGKKPHVSCLYRWTMAGCRGIQLETVQIGGTRCTSREALQRFFERLTAASSAGGGFSAPHQRTPHARQRAAERAGRELERMGM